jgi:hypothetical protein
MQKFRHSEDLPLVPQQRNGRGEESGKKRDPSLSAELRMTREYSHTALMLKINVGLLVFLMGTLWSAAAFGDEDPLSDSSPALSAPSGASEGEPAPAAGTLDEKTLREMIPQAMALAAGTASKGAAPEEGNPGVDSAVRMAQQEVRDPFAVPSEAEAPKEALTDAAGVVVPAGPPVVVELQGIGFGSKDAYAIIGGEVYYTGDEKNGIKLLEVRRREVDIQANGARITVLLFPGEELQKAKDRAEKKGAVKDAALDQKPEIPGSLSQRERKPL